MSLTATPVPETVGASDYLPTVVSSPAPSVGSISSPAGGLLAAEADPGHLAQTAAPRARPEGVVTSVEEGDGTPDMESHRPTWSKHPVPTTPVGGGEALPVPMTPPQGSEANTVLVTTVDRQPPGSPTTRRGGKDAVARDAPWAARSRRRPVRRRRPRGMKRHPRRPAGTRQPPSRRWVVRPWKP